MLLEELEEDLSFLTTDDDSGESDDSLANRRKRISSIERLIPFYKRRKDIFSLFDDQRLIATFRFDKASIIYITGNKI